MYLIKLNLRVYYYYYYFFFFVHIFVHCHPLLSCSPNFKSLAHRQVSLKSITKFHPDRYTRKRVNKNMVINALLKLYFIFLPRKDLYSFRGVNERNHYSIKRSNIGKIVKKGKNSKFFKGKECILASFY